MSSDLGMPESNIVDRVWQTALWIGGIAMTAFISIFGHVHSRINASNERIDALEKDAATALQGLESRAEAKLKSVEERTSGAHERMWAELMRMNDDSSKWREQIATKVAGLPTRDDLRNMLLDHRLRGDISDTDRRTT